MEGHVSHGSSINDLHLGLLDVLAEEYVPAELKLWSAVRAIEACVRHTEATERLVRATEQLTDASTKLMARHNALCKALNGERGLVVIIND